MQWVFLVLPHSRPSFHWPWARPVTWSFAPTGESKPAPRARTELEEMGTGVGAAISISKAGDEVSEGLSDIPGEMLWGWGGLSTVSSPGSAVEQLCASGRQLS